MKRSLLKFVCLLPLLSLMACEGSYKAAHMAPPAGLYQKTLFHDYNELAAKRAELDDSKGAQIFADKAATVGHGKDVEPLNPAKQKFIRGGRTNANKAYVRLKAQLTPETIDALPAETAHAQAMYDCWIREMTAKKPTKSIHSCRNSWNAAIANLEESHKAADTGELLSVIHSYEVYFDWNETSLRKDAAATLDQIAAEVATYEPKDITVTGHADRSGPDASNEKIAKKRALAVSKALSKKGVSTRVIDERSRGEADPAVPTKDGDKLEANRRVVIDFRK